MEISNRTQLEATQAQTITVGELRELFAALSDGTPVITYGKFMVDGEPYEDYINLGSVQMQGVDEGFPIVVLDQSGVTDNRGW